MLFIENQSVSMAIIEPGMCNKEIELLEPWNGSKENVKLGFPTYNLSKVLKKGHPLGKERARRVSKKANSLVTEVAKAISFPESILY